MTLLHNELSVVPLNNLFQLKMRIPLYQRPYRWQVSSANTLFLDIFEAFQGKLEEYRIGSVILHKEGKIYFIVDGQQRLTTLAILLHCLQQDTPLLKETYSPLSAQAIAQNFKLLKRKVDELSEQERLDFKAYVQGKCTIVKIVTDDEQEAFQFFDSQNSRGKALRPHDLLKSFHLREMHHEPEQLKIATVEKWEQTNQQQLEDLFVDYLYPLTQWYKGRDGLNYGTEKIASFKGIPMNTQYHYAMYHKASHLFVEQMRNNGSLELLGNTTLNQFQLTEPVLAGKRFFGYTLYYLQLLERVQQKVESFHHEMELPNRGAGDRYVRSLYESALLFFVDRFGMAALNDAVMTKLYIWCYSLRLMMYAVYDKTINKYARGKHERLNYGLDLFTQMSEMQHPEQLDLIELQVIKVQNIVVAKKPYKDVIQFLTKNGGIVE